jgi:hypothetical protein
MLHEARCLCDAVASTGNANASRAPWNVQHAARRVTTRGRYGPVSTIAHDWAGIQHKHTPSPNSRSMDCLGFSPTAVEAILHRTATTTTTYEMLRLSVRGTAGLPFLSGSQDVVQRFLGQDSVQAAMVRMASPYCLKQRLTATQGRR